MLGILSLLSLKGKIMWLKEHNTLLCFVENFAAEALYFPSVEARIWREGPVQQVSQL